MKYWAYVNNEILGPFEKEKLLELPSFSPSLLVCPQTPVGEKTEDWKEASTYPELSALIATGAGGAAPKPADAPAPAGETKNALPAPSPAAGGFKPLTASSLDPVAPSDHKFGGVDIPANRLGKAPSAAPAPASAEVAPNSASFDPLSLSQLGRKAETAAQAPVPGAARPPEMETFSPTGSAAVQPYQAGSGPEMETFARPAAFQPQQATAPGLEPQAAPFAAPAAQTPAPEAQPASAPSSGGDTALMRKLEAMEKNIVSRQDMSTMVDPLRIKLEQMGEVISSMKNQQFQREVMDKLAYLENAIGDIKAGMKQGAAPAQASIAPAQVREAPAATVFGVKPAAAAEKPKPEAEPPAKLVDTGSKGSKVKELLKKAGRLIVTLALLAAVLLGAVIGLKNFNIFDATGFLPFPLPFVQQAPPAQPAEEPAPATAEQPQAQQGAEQPQPQPAAAKDLSPEIVYLTRTYKLAENGPTLEDKLVEFCQAAGGDYGRVDWKVKQGVEGIYEIMAVVPAGASSLSFTFVADYNKKTLLPADERGKQALEALAGKAPRKPAAAAKGKAAPARTAKNARQQKAPAKKAAAAPKKAAPAEDEYEYEYEEEEEE